MASQKRPIQDIYAEEEYPEEDYDDQGYDGQDVGEEQEDASMEPEYEEEYEQEEEQQAAAPPARPPAKRSRPSAGAPKSQPKVATVPAKAAATKKPAAPRASAAPASKTVAAKPLVAIKPEPGTAAAASRPAPSKKAPAAPKPKLTPVKPEPATSVGAAPANLSGAPSAAALSSTPSSTPVKLETEIHLVVDAHTTVAKYIKKIEKEFTHDQLVEHFQDAYISNYDLPSCLLQDFDVTLLSELSVKAMRGNKKAGKLFLRLLQAYELAKWLKTSQNIVVRGFASENAKKQGEDSQLVKTAPLAGGEKRADQAHDPADKVAKTTYIGDPFQYPQKNTPNKVVVPENDQKRLGVFSLKSCLHYFTREQQANINAELDRQERERYFKNLAALQNATSI